MKLYYHQNKNYKMLFLVFVNVLMSDTLQVNSLRIGVHYLNSSSIEKPILVHVSNIPNQFKARVYNRAF